jgi:20S proteasome alpha/beta subunit
VAYRQQSRRERQKIYVDDQRQFAVAMTGVFDGPYIDFLGKLLTGKIDVRQNLKNHTFPELKELTLSRYAGKVANHELDSHLVIASRFDNTLNLAYCYPLGNIQSENFIPAGSGSDYVRTYIANSGKLIPFGISLSDSIELAANAFGKAETDIYTGGLDMAVLTSRGITEFGEDIKSITESARKKVITHIQQKHS